MAKDSCTVVQSIDSCVVLDTFTSSFTSLVVGVVASRLVVAPLETGGAGGAVVPGRTMAVGPLMLLVTVTLDRVVRLVVLLVGTVKDRLVLEEKVLEVAVTEVAILLVSLRLVEVKDVSVEELCVTELLVTLEELMLEVLLLVSETVKEVVTVVELVLKEVVLELVWLVLLLVTVVVDVVRLDVSEVVERVVVHEDVHVEVLLLLTVTEDVVCVDEVRVSEEDVELVAVNEVVVGPGTQTQEAETVWQPIPVWSFQ